MCNPIMDKDHSGRPTKVTAEIIAAFIESKLDAL
jgi:hypothetical protein